MSSEQGGNPLRKFKLVFLGEQSGKKKTSTYRILLSFLFSRKDFINNAFYVR
jgi:hypothetical protein